MRLLLWCKKWAVLVCQIRREPSSPNCNDDCPLLESGLQTKLEAIIGQLHTAYDLVVCCQEPNVASFICSLGFIRKPPSLSMMLKSDHSIVNHNSIRHRIDSKSLTVVIVAKSWEMVVDLSHLEISMFLGYTVQRYSNVQTTVQQSFLRQTLRLLSASVYSIEAILSGHLCSTILHASLTIHFRREIACTPVIYPSLHHL